MADLARITGVDQMLRDHGIENSFTDFEAAYELLTTVERHAAFAVEVQERIRKYFSQLTLPESVTIYDELVLSLRSKDLIATFNWDPLLAQAYKRNRHLGHLPRLVFLHGNVEVGACLEHKQKGFLEHSCPECRKPLAPQKLLYPISEKNYESDPLISNEWREFRSALAEAYMITIFGYAAPKSDVAARDAMLGAWKENPTRDLGQLDLIDIRSRKDLERTWREFFVRNHYGICNSLRQSSLLRSPRRTCDHFAMATLQQRPCKENPMPSFVNLDDLQSFAYELIREEKALELGKPLPC